METGLPLATMFLIPHLGSSFEADIGRQEAVRPCKWDKQTKWNAEQLFALGLPTRCAFRQPVKLALNVTSEYEIHKVVVWE